MKCPVCGFELDKENNCKKCGTTVNGHLKRVEVEYKEFPKSEFLEIRTKPPATPSEFYDTDEKDTGIESDQDSNSYSEEPKKSGFRKNEQLLKDSHQKSSMKKIYFIIFFAGFLAGCIFLWLYFVFKSFI
ncbi:MAG: hypothetical protein HXY52_05025 [Nitrospirae bacterium]|jgi:uncharacterized membrane protein YvbJ|nr:hypothetical protein [Nitrospirota bacterium]